MSDWVEAYVYEATVKAASGETWKMLRLVPASSDDEAQRVAANHVECLRRNGFTIVDGALTRQIHRVDPLRGIVTESRDVPPRVWFGPGAERLCSHCGKALTEFDTVPDWLVALVVKFNSKGVLRCGPCGSTVMIA